METRRGVPTEENCITLRPLCALLNERLTESLRGGKQPGCSVAVGTALTSGPYRDQRLLPFEHSWQPDESLVVHPPRDLPMGLGSVLLNPRFRPGDLSPTSSPD